MATTDILARVLVLQDRVGVRQSGHFDHDSHAMTGPTEAVGDRRGLRVEPVKKRPGQLTFRFVRDPETGEVLSK